MTFTDDDLKRLTERLADKNREGRTPTWDIIALLVRLEAAEKALDAYADKVSTYGDSYEFYKAWRKAAGR